MSVKKEPATPQESEAIQRARQDVTDRAHEHERALDTVRTSGAKLQAAQERLQGLINAQKK